MTTSTPSTPAHGPARRVAAALLTVAPLVLVSACGDDRPAGAEGPPALDRGARLVITTENGVRLRPVEGDRVAADSAVRGAWSHRDGTWVLDLACRDRRDGHDDGGDADGCPRMPTVGVPAGVPVTVTARNAGIDAVGVEAALALTTVNGDVTVTRSGGGDADVRLVTRNGSVRAESLAAGRLEAETVNGDVTLGGATSPSRVTAATTNGSVRVTLPHDAPAYDVTAGTRNGRTSVLVPQTPGSGGDSGSGDGSGAGDGPGSGGGDAADGRAMNLSTVNGDVTAGLG
ncbi:DUF4097 family beta strand repeat-containing protein [uncultured Streptomyces sp.]|uniref:DUF4097 family beta strand repeat-containing protein n=1 Tax=uncultured Streptomyces sp. TaxID=174707 RepID=UPI00262C4047|nr:DUF4097 family beta strand repeat-containing protein [uncultured Streptomyces sp.]